jgi:TonB family protein
MGQTARPLGHLGGKTMSAILLASLLLAMQDAPLRRPPPSTTDLPAWSRTPTAAEMKAAYPSEAAKVNYAGSGAVECTVAADGGLTDCVVASEDAPGFGAAALTVAPKFRLPTKSPSGASTVGRTVRFPVLWVNPSTAKASMTAPSDGGLLGAAAFNCRVRASRSLDNCILIDAQPRNTNVVGRAREVALRFTAPASSAEFSRILIEVLIQ